MAEPTPENARDAKRVEIETAWDQFRKRVPSMRQLCDRQRQPEPIVVNQFRLEYRWDPIKADRGVWVPDYVSQTNTQRGGPYWRIHVIHHQGLTQRYVPAGAVVLSRQHIKALQYAIALTIGICNECVSNRAVDERQTRPGRARHVDTGVTGVMVVLSKKQPHNPTLRLMVDQSILVPGRPDSHPSRQKFIHKVSLDDYLNNPRKHTAAFARYFRDAVAIRRAVREKSIEQGKNGPLLGVSDTLPRHYEGVEAIEPPDIRAFFEQQDEVRRHAVATHPLQECIFDSDEHMNGFEGHPILDAPMYRLDSPLGLEVYPVLRSFLDQMPQGAHDDHQAITDMLRELHQSQYGSTSIQAYHSILGRFALFVWLVRGEALATITPETIEAYETFVQDPPSSWIAPSGVRMFRWRGVVREACPDWRPFTGRTSARSAAGARRSVYMLLRHLSRHRAMDDSLSLPE